MVLKRSKRLLTVKAPASFGLQGASLLAFYIYEQGKLSANRSQTRPASVVNPISAKTRYLLFAVLLSRNATSSLQSTERIGQGAISGESQRQRYVLFSCYPYWLVSTRHGPWTASIHIFDDDSLLHVFHLYRPFLLGEDRDDDACLLGGLGD